MTSYFFITGLIGVSLAASILYLIRQDHLYLGDGLFWITVAVIAVVFGIAPTLIDQLGGFLGIAYPPTLFLVIAIAVLLIKILWADILAARTRRDLRRLNQKIAIVEAESKR